MDIAIIGGGPAGLRAAETAAAGGAAVTVFEAKASVGRKFLVAGKGGLNLTHSEERERFAVRYHAPGAPADCWTELLNEFDPETLRAWAEGLGVETFAASTGRVYPRALKAAPLLRRWVERLRGLGVQFATHHRWVRLRPGAPLELDFETREGPKTLSAKAAVLALGGGSWPDTGSDGAWTAPLSQLGVTIAPLAPANCGWEVTWPPAALAREGHPLKNLRARAGSTEAAGELMLTSYGLEGGALYRLGAELRAMAAPELTIDFKPDTTAAQLITRLGGASDFRAQARARWKLSEAAWAVVEANPRFAALADALALAELVKACPVRLERPRPLAEAISSAGGVAWGELDAHLMVRRIPGLFVAGEMIDWEAPTGGYLLQGCFASGHRAGAGALNWLRHAHPAIEAS